MLIDDYVQVRVNPDTRTKWLNKGYVVPECTWKNLSFVTVPITEFPIKTSWKGSVNCKCDHCGKLYIERIRNNLEHCDDCRLFCFPLGHGLKWPEWKKLVWKITEQSYKRHYDKINPNHYIRARAGEADAYHLDHKMSIKEGFNSYPATYLGHYRNLQMLPWLDNLKKRDLPHHLLPGYISAFDQQKLINQKAIF